MGVVIIANSLTIGVEQTYRMTAEQDIIKLCQRLEYIFLLLYSIELALRFFAHGLGCLASAWVRFDLILVVLGITMTFVVEPLMKSGLTGSGDAARAFGLVMLLRIFKE